MLEVRKELKRFGKNVVKTAKQNTRKMSGSGDLAASIDYELEVHKNSFSISFYMAEHGVFLDEGVRGAGGVRKTTSKFGNGNKGKIWEIKAKDSRFKYKPSSYDYKKDKKNMPSPKHFKSWARSKGLSPFAVSTLVYHQGIEKTEFFTKAFEKHYFDLSEELIEAYGLDIDEFLEQTLNN